MIQRELRQHLFTSGSNRPMLIEIEGGVVTVRPKGVRNARVPVNAVAIWQAGVKAQVDEQRRGKRRRR